MHWLFEQETITDYEWAKHNKMSKLFYLGCSLSFLEKKTKKNNAKLMKLYKVVYHSYTSTKHVCDKQKIFIRNSKIKQYERSYCPIGM